MSEENKGEARRIWEIVNQRNPDLVEEIYPPDFVWHEPDPIRTSEATSKPSRSPPPSLRPSPTSTSLSNT